MSLWRSGTEPGGRFLQAGPGWGQIPEVRTCRTTPKGMETKRRCPGRPGRLPSGTEGATWVEVAPWAGAQPPVHEENQRTQGRVLQRETEAREAEGGRPQEPVGLSSAGSPPWKGPRDLAAAFAMGAPVPMSQTSEVWERWPRTTLRFTARMWGAGADPWPGLHVLLGLLQDPLWALPPRETLWLVGLRSGAGGSG